MTIVTVMIAVFALNLPFGYWRSTTRKYSLPWVLAVHLPVPGVIALRLFSGIGFELYTVPLLVASFFAGQYAGARLHAWIHEHSRIDATGCLVMDLYHSLRRG
ncbi:MAG: hypothetical protein KFF77_03700 [Bacteroidetes bacterium]|nr:hypothetical protein [Bacteroidota bacterium]